MIIFNLVMQCNYNYENTFTRVWILQSLTKCVAAPRVKFSKRKAVPVPVPSFLLAYGEDLICLLL
jgi:hypothetical protein